MRAKKVSEGWVPLRHGIPSSYNRGCRCDQCRRANTVRQRTTKNGRRHQQRNYANRVLVAGIWMAPLPEERHGSHDTYNRFGCRCLACRVATREYTAARRRAAS